MKKNLSILFSIIILSAFIGLGVRLVFAQLGWEEPTNTPPFDNEIPLWVKQGNGDLYHTTGGNVGLGTISPGSQLDVAGTAQLRGAIGGTGLYVDSTGNVGIGTISPGSKLDIVNSSGAADVYGIKTTASSTYSGYKRIYGIYSSATASSTYGNDYTVGVYGGASSTQGLPIGVYGSGGIRGRGVQGTGKVGVYGYAYGIAGGTGVFAWGDTYGLEAFGDYAVYAGGNTYGIFSDSGKNYFSGNVGIGTTSPNDKLEVAGNIRLSSGFMIQAVGGSLSLNADSTNNIKFLQDGTVKAGIYGGKFGIGTNQPTGTLTVLGDLKVFSYNTSTYKYGRGPSIYRPSGTLCGCDLDPNTVNCPPLYYTNTNYGSSCLDKHNRNNYGYLYTRYDNAPALYVSTLDRVGIGTAKPQTKLDVAGSALFEGVVTGSSFINKSNIFQIDNSPDYYSRTVGRTYVVEVGPSQVGRVVKLNDLPGFCQSEVGYRCQITLGMKNWDTNKPNLMTTRGPYHFSYTGSWWRTSGFNDAEGKDNNGATNEFNAWDCYFTDAETSTNTNNGRSDSAAGFGLLNVKGGSYSDSSTGCVLIVEDITGALVKTGYLINGMRTETECANAGGTITTISGGDKICRFAQGSCSSPWLQYNSWSVTTAATCNGDQKSCWGTGCGGGSNCTTGNHAWSDTDQETCGYKDEDCDGPFCDRHDRTCHANITAVGCY